MNQKLEEIVKSINGRRKDRIISAKRAELFEALVSENEDNPEVKVIRVYSAQGFVANAYKWRAEISVLEARRNTETGKLEIFGFVTDAKRSHGNGALITINERVPNVPAQA